MPFINKIPPPHLCHTPEIRKAGQALTQILGEWTTWKCDECGSEWEVFGGGCADYMPTGLHWRCYKRLRENEPGYKNLADYPTILELVGDVLKSNKVFQEVWDNIEPLRRYGDEGIFQNMIWRIVLRAGGRIRVE